MNKTPKFKHRRSLLLISGVYSTLRRWPSFPGCNGYSNCVLWELEAYQRMAQRFPCVVSYHPSLAVFTHLVSFSLDVSMLQTVEHFSTRFERLV